MKRARLIALAIAAMLTMPVQAAPVQSRPAPAASVPSTRTSARPASAARPTSSALPVHRGPVQGYRPVPPPPPARPLPPPPLPPRIVIISSPASARLIVSGLHDTRNPYHVAACPACREWVDREVLRHLDAWWLGVQSRRMNAELNRRYSPPPPRKNKKRK